VFHLALLIPSLAFAGTFAQKPKVTSQKKKPAQQQAKPAERIVLGTAQLPGDDGKLGTAYTMGEKGSEINFTLESAEFALRAPMATETILAENGQKLLLLTFTAHNPLKTDSSLSWNSLQLTAVSPDDQNTEFTGWLYHPERKTKFETTLKPAQKVKAIVAFPIHGKGPVNKLIVRRGSGGVLRYDLRTLVKPLQSPFTKDGIDALPDAEVTVGTPVALGALDWNVERIETIEGKLGDYEAGEEEKLFAVTVNISNPTMAAISASWNTLKPVLKDANGEEIEWKQDLLTLSSNRTVETEIGAGENLRARFVFIGPKSVQPAALTLEEPGTKRKARFKF